MTSRELDQIVAQAENLSPDEQLLLIDRIVALLRQESSQLQDVTAVQVEEWDEEELQQLLNDNQPLTGKEMVEQGFFGGWEDMGIEDSLEWVNAQRAKRRNKYRW